MGTVLIELSTVSVVHSGFFAASLAAAFCFVLPLPVSAQDFNDPKALMRHIDRIWRSDSSRATLSMTVKTARYERNMKLEAWSKGKEKSLIIIRAPKKDRGIATLKVDRNIWNYLPKINRITKIPPSMMSGSWMGSHFTNDDLVREHTYEDDYTSVISFKGARGQRNIYEVVATPKPDAPVVWGKVVMEIDKDKVTPIIASYFDEEGRRVRTMRFNEIRKIGARYVPMTLTLTPEEKPGESTTVQYENIDFDLPIRDDIFSLQNLKTAR